MIRLERPPVPPPRVILLAPPPGVSGVGDYATEVSRLIGTHVDIVEMRHAGPAGDSIRAICRYRRAVRRMLRESPPGTVVHAEASGGSSASFWALCGLRAPRTMTVHDAPRPYWSPLLTRGVNRVRWLRAGLVRLLSPIHLAMERRLLRDMDVLTLSNAGARAMRELGIGRMVGQARLLVPERPPIAPPWDRPPAVGLFGHVYRGKGFDLLHEVRELLPDGVALRVAGQGTELLDDVPGVEISGAVHGTDEDEWFASVRVVLLPYFRVPIGGVSAVAASAVQVHAAAYETPCVALSGPTMDELAAEGGCEVAGDLAELTARAAAIATSDAEARQAHAKLMAYRATLSIESTVASYLRLWAEV